MDNKTPIERANRVDIHKELLVKNTLWSFLVLAIPMIISILAIPFILKGLGEERFGVLSLIWIVLGYSVLFDLGLGRATTKFVAESLGKKATPHLPGLIWTAMTAQALLGILGGVLLFFGRSFLVNRAFKIPPYLVPEAMSVFTWMAFSLPLILMASSLSGVLEASQRFDLISAIKIPSSLMVYILSLTGVLLGFNLKGIIISIFILRIAAFLAFLFMVIKTFPNFWKISLHPSFLLKLFSFGGWMTLANLLAPIFMSFERLIISNFLSVGSLTYYAVPFEIVQRLTIIPSSLIVVLFPVFSTLSSDQFWDKIHQIISRSLKYIAAVMIPIAIFILMFGHYFLSLWLGPVVAAKSTPVLSIMIVAVALNCLAYMPTTLIQSIGRPDVIVKYHAIEFPLYVGLLIILVKQFGLKGAAMAWLIRTAWLLPIFSFICFRIAGVSWKLLLRQGAFRSLTFGSIPLSLAIIVKLLSVRLGFWLAIMAGAFLLSLAAFLFWRVSFDGVDRSLFSDLPRRLIFKKKSLRAD